jgi:hypothetical protein
LVGILVENEDTISLPPVVEAVYLYVRGEACNYGDFIDIGLIPKCPNSKKDAVVHRRRFKLWSSSEERLIGGGERVEEIQEVSSHSCIFYCNI